MRAIAVVTTSRADYGIYRPLLRRLADDRGIDLQLIVGGMHLKAEFGDTIGEIESDGFPISEKVDLLSAADTPAAIAEAMGRGTAGFGQAFARLGPDIAVVLGDRFEMFAAAAAAQPFRLPLAHIHGGELTLGAIDDSFRHAMTKLSHIHFAAAEDYGRRIRQMGEEAWRVHVSGALGLDNLDLVEPLQGKELEEAVGMALNEPPLVVTYHPATLGSADVETQADALTEALDGVKRPLVITAPNADEGGRRLQERFQDFAAGRPRRRYVESLGTRGYFGLMAAAVAMVGNSSSGIIEAASFKLPVVNIGRRQEGRLRPANVIDVGESAEDILAGIDRALAAEFRGGLADLQNPFQGERPAAEAIHASLVSLAIDGRLLNKRFVDMR